MAKAPVTCQMSITSFKPPQSCVWLVPQDSVASSLSTTSTLLKADSAVSLGS